MIKLENTQVVGWEPAIRGMRNPMNSWKQSDTMFIEDQKWHDINGNEGIVLDKYEAPVAMGHNDFDLMMRLAKAGAVDAKYRRMIVVYVDITAPLYWWKEFDTYKVGTVANSCSTMHKIHAKEFTLDDFSIEHLMSIDDYENDLPNDNEHYILGDFKGCMDSIIHALNDARELYLKTKDKRYWSQMIQLLPSSYNQRRTIMLNYEVLAGIYPKRKSHRLDEWHDFCKWILDLPFSEIIVGEEIHKVPIEKESK